MFKWFMSLVMIFVISIANAETIQTESTTNSTVTTNGNMETTVKSPPPSAISPQLGSNSNSDLCTIGVAGAVQTQILGISAGTTFTEQNCLRLKNAKTLYDMGMKVAAVSVMCQDDKVFDAMMMAGTPCPYEGQIGEAAKIGWESHEETQKENTLVRRLKILKKTLLALVAFSWASYSYSDSITPYYGVTGNAASGGHSWSMDNVLPTPPGLDINGVIYDYTIQKNVDDSVNVHVGNKNIAGTGYIFRETDEWQPGSLGGTEIRKVVPVVPGLNRELWGDGSIEVDGPGSVEDPNVIYMYKVDPCYNPQFDPNCPGYEVPMPVIPDIEIYDATEDEYVNLNDDEKSLIEENEETVEEELDEDEEEEEKRKREYRLAMLADTNAAALFAENQRIIIMNGIMQKQIDNGYTNKTINGGVYRETITLFDKTLKDNKQGLRNNLAQQLLHEQMIDMQY